MYIPHLIDVDKDIFGCSLLRRWQQRLNIHKLGFVGPVGRRVTVFVAYINISTPCDEQFDHVDIVVHRCQVETREAAEVPCGYITAQVNQLVHHLDHISFSSQVHGIVAADLFVFCGVGTGTSLQENINDIFALGTDREVQGSRSIDVLTVHIGLVLLQQCDHIVDVALRDGVE